MDGNVMIPVPRTAFNALCAFSSVMKADFQIVIIKAIKQHIDDNLDGEDKAEFQRKLAVLEETD